MRRVVVVLHCANFQVVVMVCGNKPTIRRNSVQVPLRGGGPVKIMMYMQRGNVNSKNKKKKGVAKHFTPRPKVSKLYMCVTNRIF